MRGTVFSTRGALILVALIIAGSVAAYLSNQRGVEAIHLASEQPLRRESPGPNPHFYRFDGKSGEIHEIEVRQLGLDVEIDLKTPSEAALEFDNGFSYFNRELICLEIEESGPFTITIKTEYPNQTGSYQIIRRLLPTSSTTTARAQASIREGREKTRDAAFWAEQVELWRAGGTTDQALHAMMRLAYKERGMTGILTLRRALQVLENTDDVPDDMMIEAMLLYNLGTLYNEIGDLHKAEEIYRRVLTIREEPTFLRAKSLFALARNYIDNSYREPALPLLEEGRTIAERLGDEETEARCNNYIAWILYLEGETGTAWDYQEKRIDPHGLEKKTQVMIFNTRGKMYRREGKIHDALENLEKALDIADDDTARRALEANKAETLIEIDAAAAEARYTDLLHQSSEAPLTRAHFFYCQSLARYKQQKHPSSLESIAAALELVERYLRDETDPDKRIALLSDRHNYLGLKLDLLIEEGKGDKLDALMTADTARARELYRAVTDSEPGPPDLDKVRDALGENQSLIYFSWTHASLVRWTLTGEGALRFHRVGDREEITALCESLRGWVVNQGEPDLEVARRLADALLVGLDEDPDRVVLCLDGILHQIPFHLLFSMRGRIPTIIVVPSLGLGFALADDPMALTGGFAVIATPSYDADHEPLPNSAREAAWIASLFPERTRLFTEHRANRAAFFSDEVARAQVVHFAGHAVNNAKRPALYLATRDAGGAEINGEVTANEIMAEPNRLRADLVVASACRTGIGPIYGGEGVVDLSYAFFLAGAKRSLVSLWKVADAETAQLMIHFYSALAEGRAPEDALREAVIRIQETHDHPYFWAGFVLRSGFPSIEK